MDDMPASSTLYEITLAGTLDGAWSDWFEGLALTQAGPSATRLRGALPDQAALFGVLKKIHNLGLTLISVQRLEQA